jgi:uncharacterized protein
MRHSTIAIAAFALIVSTACRNDEAQTRLDDRLENMGKAAEAPPRTSPETAAPEQSTDVDSLPALEDACRRGDGLACAQSAEAYVAGMIVEPDQARAALLYERGCDLRTQRACAGLARALARGQGLPPDIARGEDLARKACDADEPWGCHELAVMYETVPALFDRNPRNEQAIVLYQQACDARLTLSCSELAMVFHSGRGGATKDIARARVLLDRACGLGDSMSCRQRDLIAGH